MCISRHMRLLLPEAATVPTLLLALLRTERLLPEGLLSVPAAMLARLVHLRAIHSRARIAVVASQTAPPRPRPNFSIGSSLLVSALLVVTP